MVIAFIVSWFGLHIHRKKVSKNLKTDQIDLDQNLAPRLMPAYRKKAWWNLKKG